MYVPSMALEQLVCMRGELHRLVPPQQRSTYAVCALAHTSFPAAPQGQAGHCRESKR